MHHMFDTAKDRGAHSKGSEVQDTEVCVQSLAATVKLKLRRLSTHQPTGMKHASRMCDKNNIA